MKKITHLNLAAALILLFIGTSFTPVEHGTFVQLVPGNNKKVVFQIVPDKTYSNVVAYINFYSANNKRVAQKAYNITDEKDKYVEKYKCTNKVFKFSFKETVTRVTIDHVSEGELVENEDGAAVGKKIDLPISKGPLGPVDK